MNEKSKKMYFIQNCGCDDTTSGLARMNDEELDFFKSIIVNLNKNSTYRCMPTIEVYEVKNENMIREANENDIDEHKLYMDGKAYAFITARAFLGICSESELKQII